MSAMTAPASPTNVTVTSDGRLWIADTMNSVIREVVR